MEFIVLLSVLAITLTQVIARPIADTKEDLKTKDKYLDKDIRLFKFKLPTVLRHDLEITIRGFLNISHENFTAVLPIENEKKQPCIINFHYKNETLLVSPASPTSQKSSIYTIEYEDYNSKRLEFVLVLRAVDFGNKQLEMTFNALNSGESPMLACNIENFEDIDHVFFKSGVETIDSILFHWGHF